MKARELIETCRTINWFEIRVDDWEVMYINRKYLYEIPSIPLLEKDVVDWSFSGIKNIPFINLKGDEK